MALDTSRIDRRFDTLKNKVSQEAEAAKQTAQEGLARKAVAQGAGGGAFAKLGMQQEKQIGAQKQAAINDIQGQQEQAVQAAEEVQANRDFARTEREAAQSFAANEAAVSRGFNKEMFDKDMSFKNKVQNQATKQFKQQMDFAAKQFGWDKKIGQFNMDMATAQFNKKDLMENLESIAPFSVTKIAGGGGGGIGQAIRGLG